VAQLLVQQARTEGEQIARVLNQALGDVGLEPEVEGRLRRALARAMMDVEGERVSLADRTAGTEEPLRESEGRSE
jgi:hypothetical protein